MMYIVHELEISGGAATRFLQGLSRDNGPTAYIFACRHCEAQPAYIDYLWIERHGKIMNSILYGCLACLAAAPFVLARGA